MKVRQFHPTFFYKKCFCRLHNLNPRMSKASRAILIPQKTLKAVVETLSNATISYKQAEATSSHKQAGKQFNWKSSLCPNCTVQLLSSQGPLEKWTEHSKKRNGMKWYCVKDPNCTLGVDGMDHKISSKPSHKFEFTSELFKQGHSLINCNF